jgi:Holliday junction DNA helicase RuvA
VLGPAELVQAIASGDRAELARASGVGPKLATRIVSELKDRTGGIVLGTGGTGQPEAAPSGSAADAVSALVNLGYRRAEAHSAVARANRELGAGAAVESLIRHGLKELGR